MKKPYRELSTNTIIFGIGTFSSKIILFILVPLYTNVLNTEQYGVADLVLSLSMLLVPIFSLMIQDAVLRFGLEKNINKETVLKNSLLVFGVGLIAALCTLPLLNLYDTISEYTAYLLVITAINMLQNILSSYAKIKDKNKIYAISGVISSLVLAFSNILFLVVFKRGIDGYLISIVLSGLATCIFLLLFLDLKNLFFAKLDLSLLKRMLVYSIPLILNNMSWWILNSSDKIMIELFLGSSNLGVYTAATKIPSLLSIVNTIFLQAWTISSIKNFENGNEEEFNGNVFRCYFAVMVFISSFLILILKPFVSIYVGSLFFECWRYVPLLLFGNLFCGCSLFFGAIYSAFKKNLWVGISTLFGAILHILINLLLLQSLGVIAACISTAISYFAVAVFRMIHSRKFCTFYIGTTKIALSTIVLLAQCILVFFELNIYIVSIISVLLILVINIKELLYEPINFLKKFIGRRKKDEKN